MKTSTSTSVNLQQLTELVRGALFVVQCAYPTWALTIELAVAKTLQQLTGRIDGASIQLATKIIKMEFQK
jgi:hypothetical protein